MFVFCGMFLCELVGDDSLDFFNTIFEGLSTFSWFKDLDNLLLCFVGEDLEVEDGLP